MALDYWREIINDDAGAKSYAGIGALKSLVRSNILQ